jgi:hypothetical protein
MPEILRAAPMFRFRIRDVIRDVLWLMVVVGLLLFVGV